MIEVDTHIPEYTLEENDKEIIIVVNAPLSKPKEAVFVLEKDILTFESFPYILKIKLPHPVHDSLSQQAYDGVTRAFKIKLKKNFEHQEESDDSDSDDCLKGEPACLNVNESKKQFYGFANKYSNMFGKLYDEFSEVVNLPDPDHTSVNQKRNLRLKEENEKWNDDHYLADTMETDHLESIFQYKPPWITKPVKNGLNDDEKQMLAEITNKSKVKLTKELKTLSECQMVDVLLGYAYNKRTTEGDNTVESGWTINKLSSTLSWFEAFNDLKSVLISFYKRSLIYPLYRSWKLSEMIHKDVVSILNAGPKQVTRCLLEVREIFNESENRYILNSMYLNDLCNFTYHMNDERCLELSEELMQIKIGKGEVHEDLPLLEIAAHLTLAEEFEEGKEDIGNKIAGLNLGSENNSSTESDSQSSDKED